ncbi:MAG: hypothetical protein EXQ58_12610 [Acidobacteria bacterium]|nr:hypothetical protein [Acidobacteriota bacterium]
MPEIRSVKTLPNSCYRSRQEEGETPNQPFHDVRMHILVPRNAQHNPRQAWAEGLCRLKARRLPTGSGGN